MKEFLYFQANFVSYFITCEDWVKKNTKEC